MSLLAYDDPTATDEFGMKRSSVISTNSTIPPTPDPNSFGEVGELCAALATSQAATIAADTKASVLEAELARFKDQHQFIAAAKEALQQQLREETVRREAAEEKVELLRGQVEQARRTVMTLQKQDQERAAIRAASGTGGPQPESVGEEPSNARKRHSLYGRGRPPSTMSVDSVAGNNNDSVPGPPPIPASGLRELRLGGHARSQSIALRVSTDGSLKSPRANGSRSPSMQTPVAAKLRRPSEGDSDTSRDRDAYSPSPPQPRSLAVSTSTTAGDISGNSSFDAGAALDAILTATQSEVLALRQQLESLSIQYAESEEARMASESCVNALREFIAGDNQEKPEAISLPPLPTDKAADMEADKHDSQQQQGKWGFNMWGKAAAPPSSSAMSNAPLPPIDASPRIAVTPPERSPTIASVASIASPPTYPTKVDEEAVIAMPTAGGLGRSLSSFFARRRPSKASTTERPVVAPPAIPEGSKSEAVSATMLGLQLEDLALTLPPPPSAPDVEVSLPTPVPAPKEKDPEPTAPLRTTPSPRPARSPARNIPPIAEATSPSSPALAPAPAPIPARSPARTPAPVEIETKTSPPTSPPPASVTTTEHDDLPTPADSPVPEDAEDFAPETPVDDEDADTIKSGLKRPQRGVARRGRAKGRGRRGAA